MPPRKRVSETLAKKDVETNMEEGFIAENPAGDVVEEILPPTLDIAFHTLAEAIKAQLSPEDDYPNLFRVHEAQKRYSDGHHALAWQHVIEILEGVLGKPIRQT